MIGLILFKIASIFVVIVFGIVFGLLYNGIDRIIVARMQSRVGPPVTQPFRDVKKLMVKENMVPDNAVKWLFNLMPVVALSAVLLVLFYLPLGGMEPILKGQGDLILVIYLLIFSSLSLVLGGFSSSSPYASVGAQREMTNLMSYEFPLVIVSISIVWLLSLTTSNLNVFSLSVIANNPVWLLVGPIGFIGLVLLFIVLLFVMSGEIGTLPFDVSKAEQEISGGVLVEYSGRNLALFYLAGVVKTVAIGSLIIALFLPWNASNLFSLSGFIGIVLDAMFFLVKLFGVIFISSTLFKAVTGRLRINQVVYFYWGPAVFASLLGLVLLWIDLILLGGLGKI